MNVLSVKQQRLLDDLELAYKAERLIYDHDPLYAESIGIRKPEPTFLSWLHRKTEPI